MPHPDDPNQRRHEAAILAALDFEPGAEDAPHPAARRQGLLFVALGIAHVVFAVLLAETLAAGRGGVPLLVAALAWGACTALVVRALVRPFLRAGVHPRHPAPG